MLLQTEFPVTIHRDEFEAQWKPLGWQILVIGPTATWKQEWGEWEAIREVVQNSLDETEAYTWGYDAQGLWLRDEGKGIGIKDYLLGAPKPKPGWARGKYGEGMKVGALVMLRKGYPVKIASGGKEVFLVYLQTPINGDTIEQLAAMWKPLTSTGTTFHIIGYRGSAYDDRFAVNIPREQIWHESNSQLAKPILRKNQIIRPGMFPGRIFSRDIYMKDIDSPFSYNLWSFELASDRYAPLHEEQLWNDMGRTWATVTDIELMKRLLGMVNNEVLAGNRTVEHDSLTMDNMGMEPESGKYYVELMQENKELWTRAFNELYGDAVVVSSYDNKLRRMVEHLGYKMVTLSWGVESVFRRVLPNAEDIVAKSQEALSKTEIIPDDKLKPVELAHLQLARAICDTLFRFSKIKVHAAIIPKASDIVRTEGMYEIHSKAIYISIVQLSSTELILDTLIHELAHHRSGAEDLTVKHAESLSFLGAAIIQGMSQRQWDAQFENIAKANRQTWE